MESGDPENETGERSFHHVRITDDLQWAYRMSLLWLEWHRGDRARALERDGADLASVWPPSPGKKR